MSHNNKLDDYGKPFKQDEVHYVMTATSLTKRCEVCRFYKQKNLYDPCHMLRNDAPLPIVGGGTCDLFLEGVGSYPGNDLDEMGEMARAALDEIDLNLPSGLKVIKTADKIYWLGWYSNNFEDLEGDIFAEEGLDFQNRMVSEKVWDAPQLWCMHQEYLRHGKALMTFRLGHFQFALGEFDDAQDNPLVEPFIKYYEENPVTMSHGFYYDPAKYVNNVFLRWRTFEVSTIKPGREANPLTQFSIEKVDKMLKGDDRKFVEGIIGKEKLEELEKSSDARGKALADAGLSFKAFGDDEEEDEEDDDEDKGGAGSGRSPEGRPRPRKEPLKPKKAGIDEVVMIEAMRTMHQKMTDVVEAASKVANVAAAAMIQSDERLGSLETKISRLNQNLLEILEPEAASKSKRTHVPDDNEAVENLLRKNHEDDPDKKGRKSLLEDLAVQMGDDPAIYKK